jgi:hypothetical protein
MFKKPSICFSVFAFMALGAPPVALASMIQATITGIVSAGVDGTAGSAPVFGFAPGTSLVGQAFTLTYTFDDTEGQQTATTCCAVPPLTVKTDIAGAGASSPGTAVLQIGGGSFTFGPSSQGNSEAYRTAPPISSTAYYYVGVQDALNDSEVFALVYPADGTIVSPDPNWESAFSSSNLSGGTYGFNISVETVPGSYLFATGELTATSITVSGPIPAGSTPEPEASLLLGIGLIALGTFRFRRGRS